MCVSRKGKLESHISHLRPVPPAASNITGVSRCTILRPHSSSTSMRVEGMNHLAILFDSSTTCAVLRKKDVQLRHSTIHRLRGNNRRNVERGIFIRPVHGRKRSVPLLNEVYNPQIVLSVRRVIHIEPHAAPTYTRENDHRDLGRIDLIDLQEIIHDQEDRRSPRPILLHTSDTTPRHVSLDNDITSPEEDDCAVSSHSSSSATLPEDNRVSSLERPPDFNHGEVHPTEVMLIISTQEIQQPRAVTKSRIDQLLCRLLIRLEKLQAPRGEFRMLRSNIPIFLRERCHHKGLQALVTQTDPIDTSPPNDRVTNHTLRNHRVLPILNFHTILLFTSLFTTNNPVLLFPGVSEEKDKTKRELTRQQCTQAAQASDTLSTSSLKPEKVTHILKIIRFCSIRVHKNRRRII